MGAPWKLLEAVLGLVGKHLGATWEASGEHLGAPWRLLEAILGAFILCYDMLCYGTLVNVR